MVQKEETQLTKNSGTAKEFLASKLQLAVADLQDLEKSVLTESRTSTQKGIERIRKLLEDCLVQVGEPPMDVAENRASNANVELTTSIYYQQLREEVSRPSRKIKGEIQAEITFKKETWIALEKFFRTHHEKENYALHPTKIRQKKGSIIILGMIIENGNSLSGQQVEELTGYPVRRIQIYLRPIRRVLQSSNMDYGIKNNNYEIVDYSSGENGGN